MHSIRILRVTSTLNPAFGGPVEGIRQLEKHLNDFGIFIETVTGDALESSWLSASGLSCIHPLGPSYTGYRYNPNLVSWIKNNLHRFDAVIVNGIWQYHSFAVWRALRFSSIPYFVFTHGMLDPWFKSTYPLKHLKKWLYWPWAEYRVLRDASSVIFTCEEERILAKQSFWLYKAKEVVTNYGTAGPPSNGPDLAQRFLVNRPQLRGKRIVLFLSRIHEKKGCDLLLTAFAEVVKSDERLHLLMAGPDQTGLVSELRTQADLLGIADNISWTGMLQGDNKWGAFYSAEVFCLPSHQENFGIVVAEALACGKPVLISNKVNIWREIQADSAGFVDTDTVEGTVRNLRRWLALDASSYIEMCDLAHRCFVTRFHIRRAAERLIEIIRGQLR